MHYAEIIEGYADPRGRALRTLSLHGAAREIDLVG